jgi:phosphatidylglycerophosphate synthase
MTRKIKKELENPIDNLIYDYMIDNIHPLIYKLKISPNSLTFISFFFGLLSVYYFLKDNYNISAFLFFIAYYFDFLDGFYARQYNMVTSMGDFLDHSSDLLKHLILFYAMYKKDKKKFFKILLIIFIPVLLHCVHLGCQQLNYNSGKIIESLDILSYLCPSKGSIQVTKYFGSGTFEFIIIILIIFWKKL